MEVYIRSRRFYFTSNQVKTAMLIISKVTVEDSRESLNSNSFSTTREVNVSSKEEINISITAKTVQM